MENGKLITWEPIQNNPFDRFKEPMDLVSMHYDFEKFELTFATCTLNNPVQEFKFTYKQDENYFYPVRHFRILEEHIRSDLENLFGEIYKERKDAGLPNHLYDSTFYKVENSSFESWYKSIDGSLPLPEDSTLEHHLYVTGNHFIDVLSEVQPTITKIK
ncbi:hypothetical protein MKY09_02655 [Psychrobacillus sp. FSL K6-4046]|uniref:hypothetical protein n=1 Tax=Psychrobacillus sp. FSL K6-4046 TaxID=2921550 RepID=UPI00315A2246